MELDFREDLRASAVAMRKFLEQHLPKDLAAQGMDLAFDMVVATTGRRAATPKDGEKAQ